MFNSLRFMLLLILVFGCYDEKIQNEVKYHPKDYSLNIYHQNPVDSLNFLVKRISLLSNSTVRLISTQPDSNRYGYITHLDNIGSYHKAWIVGFQINQTVNIDSFSVFYSGVKQQDIYKDFFFVGNYLERPSIFQLDVINKKYSLYWSSWGKEVLGLFRDPYNQNIFFTTALAFGRSGNFPFIKDARLYHFNIFDDQPKLLNIFGNGLRLSAGFNKDNLFESRYLMLDSMKTSILIKKIYSYDIYGIQQGIDTSRFDLFDYKFLLTSEELPYIANSKGFILRESKIDSLTNLSLIDVNKGIIKNIAKFNGTIENIGWSNSEDYFFIKIFDNSNSDINSWLYVYNTFNYSKIVELNKDIDEIIIQTCLLFYSYREGEVQKMILYDLINRKEYLKVEVEGGCSINQLYSDI